VASFSANGLWVTRVHPVTGVPFPPFSTAGSSPITGHDVWPAALSAAADVYVVLLGVNDAFSPWYNEGAFVASYVDLVHTLQALPSAPLVAVCTSPPTELYEGNPNPQGTQRLPGLQRDIASATGALLIDVYGAFNGSHITKDRALLCDGVHPTRAGGGVIAHAVAAGLQEALLESAGWPAIEM
jgi:lysophospholipase L1-like esterase